MEKVKNIQSILCRSPRWRPFLFAVASADFLFARKKLVTFARRMQLVESILTAWQRKTKKSGKKPNRVLLTTRLNRLSSKRLSVKRSRRKNRP